MAENVSQLKAVTFTTKIFIFSAAKNKKSLEFHICSKVNVCETRKWRLRKMCKKFLCVMWDNEQTLEYKEAVGICLGTVISNSLFSQYVVSASAE